MSNGKGFGNLNKASGGQQAKKVAVRGRYMDMVMRSGRSRRVSVVRDLGVGRVTAASKPVGVAKKTGSALMAAKGSRVAAAGSGSPSVAEKAAVKSVVASGGSRSAEGRSIVARSGVAQTITKPVAAKSVTSAKKVAAEKSVVGRPDLFSENDFLNDKSPDGNNYSLGGRSPFLLTDTKVDKRPLGPDVPESNARTIRSTKNVYSQRTPLRTRSEEMPGRGVITVAAKRKSGWLWAALTLGIIVAGGGIGFLAYMIFAQP